MNTKQEVFRIAYPNLDNVLVELVLGNTSGVLRVEYDLPEYLLGNLGRLEDLARATRFGMPVLHGGEDDEQDWMEESKVIAYGEVTDQLKLLTRKPELYFLSLFLNDVFQGDLNEVFIMQRSAEGNLIP